MRRPNTPKGITRQLAAFRRLRRGERHRHTSSTGRPGGPVTHVVLLDGTMSTLSPGCETHIGTLYKLLSGSGARRDLSLWYEAGLQWEAWRHSASILVGRGLNHQIERAYGFLAARYRPGDRIFLFGFSRGAFAVRSLAGAIDRVGLLRHEVATTRAVAQAYRHYRNAPDSDAARAFRQAHCHPDVQIEMVGVWDTVKALGLRLPLVWRLSEATHAFHNHQLGAHIRRGYHALAYDETRRAYAPELWDSDPNRPGVIEQRWFPGTHSDIGGHLRGFEPARPLANLSVVWMLGQAEDAGLPLPEGWARRFPCDATAPSIGMWRGWAKAFLLRKRRRVGRDPSETFHPSLDVRTAAPRAHSADRNAGYNEASDL